MGLWRRGRLWSKSLGIRQNFIRHFNGVVADSIQLSGYSFGLLDYLNFRIVLNCVFLMIMSRLD